MKGKGQHGARCKGDYETHENLIEHLTKYTVT
jgi:hypothetical protein